MFTWPAGTAGNSLSYAAECLQLSKREKAVVDERLASGCWIPGNCGVVSVNRVCKSPCFQVAPKSTDIIGRVIARSAERSAYRFRPLIRQRVAVRAISIVIIGEDAGDCVGGRNCGSGRPTVTRSARSSPAGSPPEGPRSRQN